VVWHDARAYVPVSKIYRVFRGRNNREARGIQDGGRLCKSDFDLPAYPRTEYDHSKRSCSYRGVIAMEISIPKGTQPNQALIKGLEAMLAKAKSGAITDGILIGVAYDRGSDEWFHHYSIERNDDIPLMIGELDLFKDILKAAVHNARNRAASLTKVKGFSGVDDLQRR
jgi:hypothetical protein